MVLPKILKMNEINLDNFKLIHGLLSLFFLLFLFNDYNMIINNDFIKNKIKPISKKYISFFSVGNFFAYYLTILILWVTFIGPLYWIITLMYIFKEH